MAKQHFFFKREAKERKLDETGNPIPLTKKVPQEDGTEVDEVVPGQFEMETKIYTDSFNLKKVIRTHTVKEGQVVVLLDDGHEETQKTPALKNKNHKGPVKPQDVIEEKNRVWVQSEILLVGEDATRLYTALEAIE